MKKGCMVLRSANANVSPHPDAEAFHRGFFKNFSKGMSVFDCAPPETFDTASVGALVMLPIIAFTYHYDAELAKQKAVEHVRLTHRSALVERSAEVRDDSCHGNRQWKF
jgi:ADP-ribosylglycohydrolase